MKIVFWSEEAACGTTSNMIATASMIVARHNCRVAMLSAEKNAHDLAGNFYTFNVKYAAEPLLLNVEMCV